MITITIIPPRKGPKYPLLFRRQGELSLPAFIQLDLATGVVTFGYSDRNTEPLYVTLGFAVRREIDALTTRRQAVKIAKDLEPLLERMCKGHSKDWDGRDNIGKLNADAEAACAEMTARLRDAAELAELMRDAG